MGCPWKGYSPSKERKQAGRGRGVGREKEANSPPGLVNGWDESGRRGFRRSPAPTERKLPLSRIGVGMRETSIGPDGGRSRGGPSRAAVTPGGHRPRQNECKLVAGGEYAGSAVSTARELPTKGKNEKRTTGRWSFFHFSLWWGVPLPWTPHSLRTPRPRPACIRSVGVGDLLESRRPDSGRLCSFLHRGLYLFLASQPRFATTEAFVLSGPATS